MESIPHRSERNESAQIALRDVSTLMPLQAMLALRRLHIEHPELSIDELHPENNSSDVRRQAMSDWLEDSLGLSVRFRTYVEDASHADEIITLQDSSGLDHLLEVLGTTDKTVH